MTTVEEKQSMQRLVLVRHGETVDNARGVTQGWSDSALSERGREQILHLASRIAVLQPTSIYSSPLHRAFETARAIAEPLHLDVIVDDDLREVNCGRWEGMPFSEIRERDAETYQRWISDPTFPCPEGESFSDVRSRMERALSRIRAECDEDNPRSLVVSHGTAIRIMATLLLDLPLHVAFNFVQDNAAINVFERRRDRFVLCVWNDAAHCNGESSR